jgi:hypothetical protein
MLESVNHISLEKQLKVLDLHSHSPNYEPISEKKRQRNIPLVSSFLKNIESLGFTLSPNIIDHLLGVDHPIINDFYKDIYPKLQEMVGDNVTHRPMYPNFPKQVMKASEAELYLNAIIHYFSAYVNDVTDGVVPTWLPEYEKEVRHGLKEKTKLKIIDTCNVNDFFSILTNILGSNTSISQRDMEIIDWFITNKKKLEYFYDIDLLCYIPTEMPHKEVMSYVIGRLINEHKLCNNDYIKTATDVLRIAVSMSNGDVSLAKQCKFRNFKRYERRLLLSLLDSKKSVIELVEDMYRYKNRWLRLGEKLNPGDYTNKFPNAAKAFYDIRSGKIIRSFASRVENAIQANDVTYACYVLTERPGEFARSLDRLLRLFPNEMSVIIVFFDKVAYKVSTPLLIQLYNHFMSRNKNKEFRFFFPKGQIAKSYVVPNNIDPLDKDIVNSIISVIEDALENRFIDHTLYEQEDDDLDIYIDEGLKQYAVPLSMRSQLSGFNIIPRGSKLKLNNNNYLRFFIHWKNDIGERTDIDLSTMFYSNDWDYKGHVSYTELKWEECSVHSGDITDAPNGASEFIDINIKGLIDKGVRYVIPDIYSFTSQPFYDIPQCFFGWMSRRNIDSGEIYEPSTVNNKVNLTSETGVSIPCIIDLIKREIVWTDLSYNNMGALNNVEHTKDAVATICQSILEKEYMSLYKLFQLHTNVIGWQTDDPDEADVLFTLDSIDWNNIMKEYMK